MWVFLPVLAGKLLEKSFKWLLYQCNLIRPVGASMSYIYIYVENKTRFSKDSFLKHLCLSHRHFKHLNRALVLFTKALPLLLSNRFQVVYFLENEIVKNSQKKTQNKSNIFSILVSIFYLVLCPCLPDTQHLGNA